MTPRTAWQARQDLVIRGLLERADLREMCLQALTALSGQDRGCAVPPPVLRVVRDSDPGAAR
jgi:hypothetical protein